MELILWSVVYDDISEASDWLEVQQLGQGKKFVGAIEKTLLNIQTFPESCSEYSNGIRLAVVRKYHYLILYRIIDDHIDVFLIVHGARDRASWEHRIPK